MSLSKIQNMYLKAETAKNHGRDLWSVVKQRQDFRHMHINPTVLYGEFERKIWAC